MANGRFPNDGSDLHPAWKKDHAKGMEEALKDALNNWSGEQDQNVTVKFGFKVTPNPGGVKQYTATITPGQ